MKRFLARVAPKVLESPKAANLDPEDQEIINMILDNPCRVRVTVEKYEGEDRNRVKDVLPASAGNDFL